MTTNDSGFVFEISLSVLNHLGRQLYRSFATVLGEAISNAWDADAREVRIYINPDRTGFWIRDDGLGMSADDFQKKFLKIGYSKRKGGKSASPSGRPYIGRKGIGKLALLSCADRISVLTKTKGGSYVGGTIDNPRLDDAITDDLTPQEYGLGLVDEAEFQEYTEDHIRGTIIRFEGLKDGVKRSLEFLRQTIALYFRFSLLDEEFAIYLDDVKVTHEDLGKLADKTEILWKIGAYVDPFVEGLEDRFSKQPKDRDVVSKSLKGARGFLASVLLPRHLKILTTDERVGVDLFVNGRLREHDIVKHIATAQIPESYLYGQIHCDALDDEMDRFTSSREGVVADDPKYQELLGELRKLLLSVIDEWDELRLKHRKDGDTENPRASKAQRASKGLYSAVATGFKPGEGSKTTSEADKWVADLGDDATYNFESYAECFISENLIRKYIRDRSIPLSPEAKREIANWKSKEDLSKNAANISIDIRREKNDLSYLAMADLANLVDKPMDKNKQAALARDASEFKPMRDAVAHTALLTDVAKTRLRTVRENIRARIKTLLGTKPEGPGSGDQDKAGSGSDRED